MFWKPLCFRVLRFLLLTSKWRKHKLSAVVKPSKLQPGVIETDELKTSQPGVFVCIQERSQKPGGDAGATVELHQETSGSTSRL